MKRRRNKMALEWMNKLTETNSILLGLTLILFFLILFYVLPLIDLTENN
jgi:hypothetical protein